MKLFMFYIGGDCGGSNIELHDIRFAAGDTAEDCHGALRRQWWGTPKSLHLDCWGAVEQADGFDVRLERAPQVGTNRLYFLNMGGYQPDQFEELHKNVLLVGETQQEVLVRAMKDVRATWSSPHRDAILEVEKTICLSDAMAQDGWFVHLTPATEVKPFAFTCRYLKLA